MTWDPAARSDPVRSHGGAMSTHLGLILHVTTNWSDPGPFFANPANQASSNWWVRRDGMLEEYVDADLRAWAQAEGNATYDSVETDGTPDVPLSPAQVETLAHLYAWGHQTYGWPFRLAERPGDAGLGWHGMGGSAWGGHPFCPGDLRRNQRQQILDRALQLVTRDGGVQHPASTYGGVSDARTSASGSPGTPAASNPADSSSEDVMATLDEVRQMLQEEIKKAVDQLHADHKVILHGGDSNHPFSIDSIAKHVGVDPETAL